MDRINECLMEYKGWCEKLGITTVSDVNKLIRDGKTSWLINISEIWQEQKISEIAKTIKDNISKKKIILMKPTREQEKQADKFNPKIPCPSDSQHKGSEEQLCALSNPFLKISCILSGSPCETSPPMLPSEPSAV